MIDDFFNSYKGNNLQYRIEGIEQYDRKILP